MLPGQMHPSMQPPQILCGPLKRRNPSQLQNQNCQSKTNNEKSNVVAPLLLRTPLATAPTTNCWNSLELLLPLLRVLYNRSPMLSTPSPQPALRRSGVMNGLGPPTWPCPVSFQVYVVNICMCFGFPHCKCSNLHPTRLPLH